MERAGSIQDCWLGSDENRPSVQPLTECLRDRSRRGAQKPGRPNLIRSPLPYASAAPAYCLVRNSVQSMARVNWTRPTRQYLFEIFAGMVVRK